MKLKFLFTLMTCWCTVSCTNAQTDSNLSLSEKLDNYLKAYEKVGFSGAVLLAEKGKITLHKGYGYADDNNKTTASTNSIWTIGSITKPFTAAAILKLEMLGKLRVEDQIDKHISGLNKEIGNITIHQLLTHSAGLREYSGSDNSSMSTDKFIDLLNYYPLINEPGSQFSYSNVGYTLLGILIEKVSGQSYEAFIKTTLLQPAGMEKTGYSLPTRYHPYFAVGYHASGTPWGTPYAKNKYLNPEQISWNLKANGGLLSTPMDMYHWYRALQGENILSEEAKSKYFAEQMETPNDFSPFNDRSPGYYGYGWAVTKSSDDKTVIMHGGSNDVFEAGFMFYPEEDIFLFMASNRAKHPASRALLDFDKMNGGKAYEIPVSKKDYELEEDIIANYLGQFKIEDGSRIEIGRGDGDFSNWLTVTPLDKGAYQKIVGKTMKPTDQTPYRSFIQEVIEQSKAGLPYSVMMPTGRKRSKRKKNDSDQEVILGKPDKSIEESMSTLWGERTDLFGDFKELEYWATVKVHESFWVYHKLHYERGAMYVLHVIRDGEIKRISMKENKPFALFLKPLNSSHKFREVNNEARYNFSGTGPMGVTLEVSIHKRKFKAIK